MHRPLFSLVALITSSITAAALFATPAHAQNRESGRPNIVFMLVDNMGYGDLSSYVGGEIRGVTTPKIDALAAEGLRLTNFNVEPECTPTRSALMTGRLPIRSGTDAVTLFGGVEGLTPWEYTLAELLSDAGYRTALYGKWHLGATPGRFPTDQGFDEWYGIAKSTAPTVWSKQRGFNELHLKFDPILEGTAKGGTRRIGDYTYEARRLIDREVTDRSVAYIKKHAKGDAPFFLYIPFTLPHAPPLPHPDFDIPEKSDYQNVLREIDHNAGRVLDAIAAAGIKDKTIAIFASDNGPQTMMGPGIEYGGHSDTGPFRAEFASAWEGAVRTPGIIRWPGRTKAGRVSNEIVSTLDFYRTLANVVGSADRVPKDRPIDSIDQTAFMFGDQKNSNREHVLFFHRGELLAVKFRNYKIHYAVRKSSAGTVTAAGQGMFTSEHQRLGYPYFFDLENDPKELFNIVGTARWTNQVIPPILEAYYKSLAEHPNIKPGEDRK